MHFFYQEICSIYNYMTDLLSLMFVNSLKILTLISAGHQTLGAQGHNIWTQVLRPVSVTTTATTINSNSGGHPVRNPVNDHKVMYNPKEL